LNRFRLRAVLVVKATLRYTPAGLPVLEAGFRHTGTAVEAGLERELAFDVKGLALGSVGEQLYREPLGAELELGGFLAPRGRRTSRIDLHITEYKRISGV
jgi:primosomal replication protein N